MKKATSIKCKTKYCRNRLRYNGYCSKCRTRRQKQNSPFKYYYQKLKHRAKERGKVFNLAFEQFKLIWLCEPDKWNDKLTQDICKWQMDRIFNDQGYHFDNIQILSKKRNILKYHRHDKFHLEVRWTKRANKPTTDERAPF